MCRLPRWIDRRDALWPLRSRRERWLLGAIPVVRALSASAGAAFVLFLVTPAFAAGVWSVQTSGITKELNAVSCPNTSDCWGVAAAGKITVTTNGGSTWWAQTSSTAEALNGVSCPSTSDCWAVGAAGTIVATTNGGSTWSAQTSGTAEALAGVSCPNTSDCWAAGASGTIVAYPGCGRGSLGLTVPSSLTFPSLRLNGTDQTAIASAVLAPDDETGSGLGWSISVYATTFADASGHALPPPTATAASSSAAAGNCSVPTNSVTYPTPGFASTSATATKIYDAASGTGAGPVNVTMTFSDVVPANQRIARSSPDTFSSTWTLTIASGP
jgi:hypothetical protein